MRKRVWGALIVLLLLVGVAPACGESPGACVPISTDSVSVARLWTEATLNAIRRDFPAPTVHARNLWHLSAVMWDSWAAYTPEASTYFAAPTDVLVAEPADRAQAEETIAYAAHRLLTERYEFAIGGEESIAEFDRLLADLCHRPATDVEPGGAAALGQAIADAAITFGADDGASEITRYIDLSYQPVNDPLLVASDEIDMADPNRWQPLQLAERVTQNGQALGPGVQVFIGSQWGAVSSFALPPADDRGVTLDPGPPPLLGSSTEETFVRDAVEVIGYADALGGETGLQIVDRAPMGYSLNPSTGEPYAPNEMLLADYGRVVAEYWADGPESETPPGHWNTLAITASDALASQGLRWEGTGPVLDRLEWDLQLFFVLNGSLHDAAIAAWGAKRAYDYARPISMVRYLGSRGELPETPGLVELVTAQSSQKRHMGLSPGSTAVRSWLGPVDDIDTQVAGVGWLEATNWLPYQRPTFVSPAFAGYVSGHSAFSRAAADILTASTGSEFFPGGLYTHTVPAGALVHEAGPSDDVHLQWATYRDAADEAGESRRYGGIHVAADDIAGRLMGAQVAERAWAKAQDYFAP